MGLLKRLWGRWDYKWYEVGDLVAMARNPVPATDAEFRIAGLDEVAPWIVAQGETGLGDRREDDSIRRGEHLIVAAEVEGEFAGYIKVGWGQLYLLDQFREVTFPDGCAFVYDTYVSPHYRGKHIALGLILTSGRVLHERGMSRYVCHIRADKAPSQRAFMRAGFVEVAPFLMLTRFGKAFWKPSLEQLLQHQPD